MNCSQIANQFTSIYFSLFIYLIFVYIYIIILSDRAENKQLDY